MKEQDFSLATPRDRTKHVVTPQKEIPLTELVAGSYSRLLETRHLTISFLTMKANSRFELHKHDQEQCMIVISGYCDEVIEDKIYRLQKGDVVFLPSGISHGAFIRDEDCEVIDVFSPHREDYHEKYLAQHSDTPLRYGKEVIPM
jgi:quercetin dioxygenase-like cupin family protein